MALAPRDDPSGIRQGTLDWAEICTHPVILTLDTLACYSKAGIDSMTVTTGQTICSSLTLPPKVKRDVLEHVSKLPRISLYSRVAWFGFGLRQVLHHLTQMDGGISCLALCGCLTESYDLFYGAHVLSAFCKIRCPNIPSEVVPGIQLWQALLKPCAGIFSNTKFPKVIDGFQRILASWNEYGIDHREATALKSLAQALYYLAQLSGKHLETCTFSGGFDCAWLAAFAEFALGLSVDIKNPDGVYLYRSDKRARAHGGEAQVTILEGTGSSSSLEIASKCFSLASGMYLINYGSPFQSDLPTFHSRSPWANILGDAFGTSVQDLLKDSTGRHFAYLLVFLAGQTVTYEDGVGFQEGNQTYSYLHLRHCAHSPQGEELLRFTASRLPELQLCLEAINYQRSPEVSHEQALFHLEAIEKACACVGCSQGLAGIQLWCLRRITATIISYIRILSMVDVQEVLPTAFGLRKLRDELRVLTTLPMKKRHMPFVQEKLVRSRFLLDVNVLFSTPDNYYTMRSHGTLLAFATKGVCCWYGLLVDVKCPPSLAVRVYVMPGHLAYQGSIFEMIEDLPLREEAWSASSILPKKIFDLVAKETRDACTLLVAFRGREEQFEAPCMFSARRVIDWAFQATVRPHISHDHPISLPDRDQSEMLLDYHTVNSQEDWHENNPPHQNSKCQLVKDSVIHILMDSHEIREFEIYKSSTQLWDNLDFSFAQLYASYGREFGETGRRIASWIGPLSDCPRCIMAFVTATLPDWSFPSRNDPIHGHITVQKTEEQSSTSTFELRRVSKKTAAAATPRIATHRYFLLRYGCWRSGEISVVEPEEEKDENAQHTFHAVEGDDRVVWWGERVQVELLHSDKEDEDGDSVQIEDASSNSQEAL